MDWNWTLCSWSNSLLKGSFDVNVSLRFILIYHWIYSDILVFLTLFMFKILIDMIMRNRCRWKLCLQRSWGWVATSFGHLAKMTLSGAFQKQVISVCVCVCALNMHFTIILNHWILKKFKGNKINKISHAETENIQSKKMAPFIYIPKHYQLEETH